MSVNGTGSISVKVPENTLPVGDVLPKSRELFDINTLARGLIAWVRAPHTLKAYGPVSVRVLDMDNVGVVFSLMGTMAYEYVHQHFYSINVES